MKALAGEPDFSVGPIGPVLQKLVEEAIKFGRGILEVGVPIGKAIDFGGMNEGVGGNKEGEQGEE